MEKTEHLNSFSFRKAENSEISLKEVKERFSPEDYYTIKRYYETHEIYFFVEKAYVLKNALYLHEILGERLKIEEFNGVKEFWNFELVKKFFEGEDYQPKEMIWQPVVCFCVREFFKKEV